MLYMHNMHICRRKVCLFTFLLVLVARIVCARPWTPWITRKSEWYITMEGIINCMQTSSYLPN